MKSFEKIHEYCFVRRKRYFSQNHAYDVMITMKHGIGKNIIFLSAWQDFNEALQLHCSGNIVYIVIFIVITFYF